MKPGNIQSIKPPLFILLGLLIPLIFIFWSVYLILTLNKSQNELNRIVEVNLKIVHIDDLLHKLENTISTIHSSKSNSEIETEWQNNFSQLHSQIETAETAIAIAGLQDVSDYLHQIKVETNNMNSSFIKLIAVRENPAQNHNIDEEIRGSLHIALRDTREALQGLRARQRATSILLVEGTRQLNYIVVISCVFSLLSFIIFLLYRRNNIKHRLIEKKLKSSEERFSKAFHFSPFPILITSFETNRIIDVNEKFFELTGYSREELIGRTTAEVNLWVNPKDRLDYIEMLKKAGRVSAFESQGRHKDGSERTILISSEIIEIEGEKCILGTIEDISERRKAEEELRLSEERFYKAFQANPNPMTISDIETGVFLDVNESFASHLGLTRDDVVGLSAFEIGLWNSTEEREQMKKQLIKSGTLSNIETTLRNKKSGQASNYLLSITPIEINKRKCLLVAAVDITESKRSQARRNLQFAVTQILSESDTAEIAMSHLVRVICENLEWDLGELLTFDLEKSTLRCANLWLSPALNADVSSLPFLQDEKLSPSPLVRNIIETKEARWLNDLKINPDYSYHAWAEMLDVNTLLAFPVITNDKVTGIIVIFNRQNLEPDELLMEMTVNLGKQIGHFIERKHTETALKKSEERLQQGLKMEAIGRLAGGVAHDFNNILTAITGYSDLTLRKLESNSPLKNNVAEIKKAAVRAAALTNQLLAFSRKQFIQPKTLNLNETVSNVDQMLKRLIGEDIQLLTNLDPKLFPVKTDPTQIELALLNLAVNARDAMPNGGKMTVETANVILDENYTHTHSDVIPGEYVMLAVSDTGHGIDKEMQAHIFEPFFTTKPKGKGTGLGLSTVYGIVKQSKGHVWFYSEVGKGTTFKIYLPRVQDEIVKDKEEKQTDILTQGWETILLVEDESAVRASTKEILKLCGYTVIEAHDGLNALDLCANYKEMIHLVLTDVVMPQMNGSELVSRLVKILPDAKILFMSGYTDDAIIHHGVLEEGINFIEKPFTPDALARKIREVLG